MSAVGSFRNFDVNVHTIFEQPAAECEEEQRQDNAEHPQLEQAQGPLELTRAKSANYAVDTGMPNSFAIGDGLSQTIACEPQTAIEDSDAVMATTDMEATTTADALSVASKSPADVKVWSMEYFGLFYQYFAVGIFIGAMNPLMYPVFSYILGMPSYTVKGAFQVLTMWWSFKVFIGALSDCVPIYGYRRKPYIIAAWSCVVVLTGGLIAMGQPKPGDSPIGYLLLLSAINLAVVWGDVACDGLLTDLAKQEPIETRGRLQSSIYTIRFIATAIVGSIMAFSFSSKEYGGTFDWGFRLDQFAIILLGVALIGIYPYCKLKDTPGHERKNYIAQFSTLFGHIRLNAVWRVIMFSFLVHFFAYFSNAAAYDIERQWCGAEPWVDGLFGSVLSNLIVAIGIWCTKKYFLNTSWRKLLAITITGIAVLSYIPSVLIDFAVIRSQFFYVGAPLVNQFIYGIFFIVSTFCAVEVAQNGSEGIMFGLITTVGNLSSPFATIISANIAAQFNLYLPGTKTLDDSHDGRLRMFALDSTLFVLQLIAIPCLFVLPAQKAQVQALVQSGRQNLTAAIIVVVVLIFCLAWAVMGNFLQIFKSTACLKLVGGDGC